MSLNLTWHLQANFRRGLRNIFVAPTGQIHNDKLVFRQLRRALDDFGYRVGRFQGGDDSFQTRQFCKGFQGFIVRGVGVLGSVFVAEPGMFGTDGGIVQTGGDTMRELDLPVFVLEQVGTRALQNAK